MALSPTPASSSNPILSPQLENLNHKKKKKYKKKEKKILVESQVENLTGSIQQQQNVSTELSLSSPQHLNQKKKRKYNKKAKKNLAESLEKNENLHLVDSTQQQNQNVSPHSPSSSLHHQKKRNNFPGVRVRGGRIFDSENGKTCHQCRQKTRDLVADCKSQRDTKSCTIKFCHKCLRNRYGENAEEANHMADWKCPKCRGVCNCSFCMKKKGHQPTGILVHTAKATGFGSVLELLAVSGPENITALREKRKSSDRNVDSFHHQGSLKLSGEGKKIKEHKRKKLENSNIGDNVVERSNADGTILKKRIKKRHLEIDLNVAASEEDVVEKVDGCEKQLKININKWKRLARVHSGVNVLEGCQENCVPLENNTEKPCTSSGISLNSTYKELNMDEVDSGSRKKPKQFHIHKIVASDPINTQQEIDDRKNTHIGIYDEKSTGRQDETYYANRPFPACDQTGGKVKLEDKQKAITKCKHKNESDVDSSLPQGISLTTVADIELPAEDVLHFLEFCNAFGEELLSKEVPHVLEPAPNVPFEMLASLCNFVHMIS